MIDNSLVLEEFSLSAYSFSSHKKMTFILQKQHLIDSSLVKKKSTFKGNLRAD